MSRYAAVDIGSNSIRMLAAEVSSSGVLQELASDRQVVRLGTGVFREGRLSTEAITEACQVLTRMAGQYRRLDVLAVRAVASIVRAGSKPGERVLTTWSGYLVGTDASPVEGTGLANFVLDAVNRLRPDEIRRHQLLTQTSVEALIRSRRVRLIVYRPWAASEGPRWTGLIEGSGYRYVAVVSTARIYRLPTH